jgi:DNA (cytosine-5)-methyltransferase 1
MLTVLDLFSGIGGFSLGLERTGGFKTIAFCEIDPFCRRVLNKHWPEVPIYEDVQKLTLPAGFADVIAGGFPCQDISNAGKGAGIEGERSGLWKEYTRIIGEVRPRYVLVENVAALLGRGLGRVLGDLAALGYDAEWHCIPASAVGAPHRRDRVWVVAYAQRSGFQGLELWQSLLSCSTETFPKHFDSDAPSWNPLDVGAALVRARDGVSRQAHRIKSCGNSVVPQIPELIGRAILKAEAA